MYAIPLLLIYVARLSIALSGVRGTMPPPPPPPQFLAYAKQGADLT